MADAIIANEKNNEKNNAGQRRSILNLNLLYKKTEINEPKIDGARYPKTTKGFFDSNINNRANKKNNNKVVYFEISLPKKEIFLDKNIPKIEIKTFMISGNMDAKISI